MVNYYDNFKKSFKYYFPVIFTHADKNKKIIKFLIAGSTAAAVDLGLLYILTEFFGLWYIISATFSYLSAFFVSFVLQKFWTFRDNSSDKFVNQFLSYFTLATGTMLLNLFFLYVLVDLVGIYYVLAQAVVGLTLAVFRFLVNNFIIFKKARK